MALTLTSPAYKPGAAMPSLSDLFRTSATPDAATLAHWFETVVAVQRSAAIDRIADSLALLSGAGCGKTFVLARRFTELLLASGINSVRMLTFWKAITPADKRNHRVF